MSEKRRRRKGAEDSEGSDLSETEPEKLNKSVRIVAKTNFSGRAAKIGGEGALSPQGK